MSRWPPSLGDELDTWTWPSGFAAWNRYAAVTNEFFDTHMDDDAGRAAGFPGAFGLGELQVAYFHNVLRAWLAGRGYIQEVACRFHSPSFKGGQVVVHGTVTGVLGAEVRVELQADDEKGISLCTGQAKVVLV
jgi:acyl dehydratase